MPTVLTDADEGREIALRPGERAEIRLPENGTTGYGWEPAVEPPGVLEPGPPRVEAGGPAPGATGTRVVPVTAAAPGRAVVTLRLCRPWERDVPPRRTVVLVFVVS